VPSGIQLIPIDPNTGERAAYGDANVILEAFKPGESPSTTPLVIGDTVMPVSTGGLGGTAAATGAWRPAPAGFTEAGGSAICRAD
jgi:penicillin-binding protein 1A